MSKKILYFVYSVVALLLLFLITSLNNKTNTEYIDFKDTVNINENYSIPEDIVTIGIISVTGGNKGYVSEKELVSYIGKKLNKKVKLVQKKSYKEINTLLKNNQIDIAFLSTGAYSLYEDKKDLELIARPNRGKAYYHPIIITRKDSEIEDFEELKDKNFAFVDNYSYSGYLAVNNYFKQQNTTINKFFNNKYYFTYSHEDSIKQVLSGAVYAASIDDWALQNLANEDSNIKDNIKVIKIFPEVATGPVVTHKNYKDKEKLKNILFNIDKDSTIKAVLERLQIKNFEDTKIEDYPTLLEEVKDVR
ncbi:phosphate/phosphite/phosphonate ABC transporter, periplasmic binding protein [Gemella bergeri ATCC 700627]|uniref:Phosphate/phosphite/phosphonate ABC transporter, periplasmic binding protein n=1 Tax=Gemella bergeri ATCC 700627 TaxID=1321820 RepID=U2QU17_9BACL|nr:phosphate/phosphite/phosphonate ABC transporter substrate-binding protein [Gemella bergeri]ERK60001.1 phosphate/phosphite/phosphonate ABC transporter, periplasmic binding protein [Gemella bergeri ATCC 700627]